MHVCMWSRKQRAAGGAQHAARCAGALCTTALPAHKQQKPSTHRCACNAAWTAAHSLVGEKPVNTLCALAGLLWVCCAGDGRTSDTQDAAWSDELRLEREPASPQWAGAAQLTHSPSHLCAGRTRLGGVRPQVRLLWRGGALTRDALPAGDYSPGDQLGKYRVLEVLGRGSNGVTYKVREPA